jgi:hypothetical protein
MIAALELAVGNWIVKSPFDDVLSEPKSRITHAGFVRELPDSSLALGVLL